MMDRLIFVEKMKEAMTEFWLVFLSKDAACGEDQEKIMLVAG